VWGKREVSIESLWNYWSFSYQSSLLRFLLHQSINSIAHSFFLSIQTFVLSSLLWLCYNLCCVRCNDEVRAIAFEFFRSFVRLLCLYCRIHSFVHPLVCIVVELSSITHSLLRRCTDALNTGPTVLHLMLISRFCTVPRLARLSSFNSFDATYSAFVVNNFVGAYQRIISNHSYIALAPFNN
jgi:hypothetical protein